MTTAPARMSGPIKEEWVKRLASGLYVQGKGWLNATHEDGIQRFCCLGVLCEIAAERDVVRREEAELNNGGVRDPFKFVTYRSPETGGGSATAVPASVRQWAGMDRATGNPVLRPMTGHGPALRAQEANDRDLNPLTFQEIAALIWEHL